MKPKHTPVLLGEVIRLLNPQPGAALLDATAGYGGHAAALIERIGDGRAVLVDRDRAAIQALDERFGDRVQLIHGNYLEVAAELSSDGSLFDLILLDLGVSSPQL